VTTGDRARRSTGAVAGLAQLRGYRPEWLRLDVVAGVTVTAYLVPQCLAYGDLAGVDPVTGLWVAVIGMVLYALLGTSRQLSVGPESATAVMVAAAVAPLAGGDPARYAALCAGLALLVGLFCIGAWALRLGFVADLLSQPILIGYMAGVGLIMIGSQLGTLTGVHLTADRAIGKSIELAGRLDEVQVAAVALGLSVTVFLFVLRRIAPLAPGALIAVVGSAALVYILGLEARGIALVGPVPSGLPSLSLPALGLSDIQALLGSAAAIAFVGYTDVALTGRAFAAHSGETIDPNREFLGMGVANVGAGLIGGFALSASGSRTAILGTMGAKSQAAGLVSALSVVIVVLAVPGLIALIPRATLGGIVIYAGIYLIDWRGLRRLAGFRMTELGLALTALVGVLVFDVLAGILIAVGLSVAELFVRVARPPAAVLGRVPSLAGLHNIEDYPDAEQIEGLLVFRYDAPLCFANAEDFRERALKAVDTQAVAVERFLLNAEAIVELDITAADALRQLIDDLAERGVQFSMARVKQEFRAQLVHGGLLARIDEEHIYPTLPVAVEAFERWHDRH
jgi:high affinity sulfate transporter 1